MLRAAAKNFVHVAPVCSPGQYAPLLGELDRDGDLSRETRRRLAAEAFSHTAAYEASIAGWFADRETFPPQLIVSLEKIADLTYGENPHQRAAYYAEAGVRRHLLSRAEQLGGRELSFNNLNDLDAARAVLREFELPCAVIVKHVGSNAIVIAKDLQTIGIGAGQMSRVDAVRLAVEKARELGHDLAGATLASDAFFPFADGPQLALDAGVTAIVQPGGSKRDDEVIAAVEAAAALMVFTSRRHFRH